MMLNEMERRKPEFSEGYPVTMADGQKWTLPKPRHRFKPKIVAGRVEIAGGATFGPESDGDLEILYGVVDVEPGEFLRVQFAMAVRLLLANYALSDDEVAELIVLEPDDPAAAERWTELTKAITGVAPKPMPAT
jgi:hypothetical protein